MSTVSNSHNHIRRLSTFPPEIHKEFASYLDDASLLKMRFVIHFPPYREKYEKPIIAKRIFDESCMDDLLDNGLSDRGISKEIPKQVVLKISETFQNRLTRINLISADANHFICKFTCAEIDTIISQQTNLQSLSLSRYSDFEEVKEGPIPKWPASLNTLILDAFKELNENFIKSLPKNLTTLLLDNSVINDAHVQYLPRCLTSFIADGYPLLMIGSPAFFKNSVSHLPSNLTTLTLPYARHWMDEDIGRLPRQLETLILSSTHNFTRDCFSLLPKSLTVLDLGESKGLNITAESCKLLPKLKILQLSNIIFSYESVFNFPSTLTKLHLKDSHIIVEEIVIDQNLENLTEMNISSLKGAGVENFVHALPSTLKKLNLANVKIVLTPDCISLLPRNLTELDLTNTGNLTCMGILELPQQLISLNLSGCNIKDNGVMDLPRSLTKLDLTNAEDLTDEGISQLPPKLRSLNLYGCDGITDDCIPNLPKNLTEISCSYYLSELDENKLKKAFPEINVVDLTD